MIVQKTEKIPRKFHKGTHTFRLIKRGLEVAIYAQENNTGRVIAYEVHKIRKRSPSKKIFPQRWGTSITSELPSKEILAYNSQFGTFAWSYQNKDEAEKKFEGLINSEKEGKNKN